MKLIIHIQDDIDENNALEYVQAAIRHGKVSRSRGIEHYSHITTFRNGIVVSCRPNSESSFRMAVWKE